MSPTTHVLICIAPLLSLSNALFFVYVQEVWQRIAVAFNLVGDEFDAALVFSELRRLAAVAEQNMLDPNAQPTAELEATPRERRQLLYAAIHVMQKVGQTGQ